MTDGEVDVVIVGGKKPSLGGCVIAGRLAESDQSLQCLIIEAGGDNYNLVEVRTPGYMGKRNPNAFKVYAGNATDVSHPPIRRYAELYLVEEAVLIT